MNEKTPLNSFISEKVSEKKLHKDACTTTYGYFDAPLNDGRTSTQARTYELFLCILHYSIMFLVRLCKDIYQIVLCYFYSDVLPNHIVELLRLQRELQIERESATYRRTFDRTRSIKLSMRKLFQAFKSYVVSSEDDIPLQCTSKQAYPGLENEPVFVFVESNSLSSPNSRELLVESRRSCITENTFRSKLQTHTKQDVVPFDTPSTSKDYKFVAKQAEINYLDTKVELQVADINLQSENEIPIDENDIDEKSVVISYLRNRNALIDREGMMLSTKKKSSLLRSVPKMETILEGEQFCAFPVTKKYSETSLDARIPSFPSSPRSLEFRGSKASISSGKDESEDWKRAIEFLHRDNDFLIAAETGNEKLLDLLIRKGLNVHQRDHIGRNALHLAVCAESIKAISLLLKSGINPNLKDNLGMTPLSLCLMRRPSLIVANLLFSYGAVILPRQVPSDTGLFLQFVMMCTPTSEERKILYRLVEVGGKVNDAEAPGGRQAIHFAAMSNNCRLIRLLVRLGADLNMRNHRNETATQVAKTFNCKDAYQLLTRIEKKEIIINSD